MQRYFTLQIFECFYIPIDDLWAEFAVLMVCACVDACTHFFAGTQFYALHRHHRNSRARMRTLLLSVECDGATTGNKREFPIDNATTTGTLAKSGTSATR